MLELLPVLSLNNGVPVVSSLKVAEHFRKQHAHLLRTIANLYADLPENFSRSNFGLADYLDSQGKKRPFYEMTRDGFSLVVMGFTGPKALAWKVRYIEAFNTLERELAGRKADESEAKSELPPTPVVGLPHAVFGIRPALRATALHSAVQAAKMGGNAEDIERLFLKFCGWLGPRPQPQATDEDGQFAPGWLPVFRVWCGECCTRSSEVRTSADRLYNHFCSYLHETDPAMPKPSMKLWGHEMSELFNREKINTIWYHCALPGGVGAVALSRRWQWKKESPVGEQ